jgi:hypothetical protein
LSIILQGIYFYFYLIFKNYFINYFKINIIRDNALLNDTLLEAFIRHYNKEGIKFQGDILYITYVLNLVI